MRSAGKVRIDYLLLQEAKFDVLDMTPLPILSESHPSAQRDMSLRPLHRYMSFTCRTCRYVSLRVVTCRYVSLRVVTCRSTWRAREARHTPHHVHADTPRPRDARVLRERAVPDDEHPSDNLPLTFTVAMKPHRSTLYLCAREWVNMLLADSEEGPWRPLSMGELTQVTR